MTNLPNAKPCSPLHDLKPHRLRLVQLERRILDYLSLTSWRPLRVVWYRCTVNVWGPPFSPKSCCFHLISMIFFVFFFLVFILHSEFVNIWARNIFLFFFFQWFSIRIKQVHTIHIDSFHSWVYQISNLFWISFFLLMLHTNTHLCSFL